MFTAARCIGTVAAVLFGAAAALTAPEFAPITVPRLPHPGAGQTVYFVLTDRFANGSTANDRGGFPGGPDDHGFDPTRISHFHGGDFVGLAARLDYLKALGVTAVWVTPPFKNKPVQRGSAGYHGYWILDFLQVDPHLGTNDEFRAFVRQAHARGLKVYMDIVVNHTADVIQPTGGTRYVDKATAPYRDAAGRPFDERAVAFNGLNASAAFPALAAETSFARRPIVPAAEAEAKTPAWLNDVTLYHNRGDATFVGEDSTLGDFSGLDDLFTEHPRVVRGFIEIFTQWLETTGIDGFRIDTAKHVNGAFWQAFSPAIRARARELGRPDFLQFGEVYNEAGDPAFLAEFSTGTIPIDTTLDFGFFAAARRFVSQQGTAAALADFFARDDYYTDHDSNVHATPTFLGNHDAGRFAYLVRQDNPGVAPEQVTALVRLGHGLLYLSRGQPVVYYGDEQGMIGRGGVDMQAREDMFAAQAPDFRDASLLATARTGADDKFDPAHPFYRLFAQLGALRAAHPALRTGAMIPRPTPEPGLFAFSRIERGERIEYLVALNNSRTSTLASRVPTGQPAGARLQGIFASFGAGAGLGQPLVVDAEGAVRLSLPPLAFAVWRAAAALPAAAGALQVALVNPGAGSTLSLSAKTIDGQVFPSRTELRAEVTGGDGYAEVTFLLRRASCPGQSEYLGTDDTAPYRVFWCPPADLAPGDELTFTATASDLRGRQATASIDRIRVAAGGVTGGIPGSTVPRIVSAPPAIEHLRPGGTSTLAVRAEGTEPLEYLWLRDGAEVEGATSPVLPVTAPGRYVVLVRNRVGTAVSEGTVVAAPAPMMTP